MKKGGGNNINFGKSGISIEAVITEPTNKIVNISQMAEELEKQESLNNQNKKKKKKKNKDKKDSADDAAAPENQATIQTIPAIKTQQGSSGAGLSINKETSELHDESFSTSEATNEPGTETKNKKKKKKKKAANQKKAAAGGDNSDSKSESVSTATNERERSSDIYKEQEFNFSLEDLKQLVDLQPDTQTLKANKEKLKKKVKA